MSGTRKANLLAGNSTNAFSQPEPPFDLSVFDPLDMDRISRAEFIEENEKVARAFWDPSMLLFSRLGPKVADVIPPFEWSDAYDEAFGCMYDAFKNRDALDASNEQFADIRAVVEYIYADPNLNMLNMMGDDALLDALEPSEIYAEVANSCNLIALNANMMNDSGLMDAFMSVSMEE
jgi:hypothetical protein